MKVYKTQNHKAETDEDQRIHASVADVNTERTEKAGWGGFESSTGPEEAPVIYTWMEVCHGSTVDQTPGDWKGVQCSDKVIVYRYSNRHTPSC